MAVDKIKPKPTKMCPNDEMIRLQAAEHDLEGPRRWSSPYGYILYLMHTFAYVQAAAMATGKTVLDLGCNTGYGTRLLATTANHVVGVDVSAKAIRVARQKYRQSLIDFDTIDGIQLPFESACFDLVVSFQVIEHIVDHVRYLKEIKRVLQPTGIAIFTTPNASIRLDPGMKPWNRFHAREFRPPELKQQLIGFFPAVRVYGLFAEEPLYSIEKNRLYGARRKARKQAQKGTVHRWKEFFDRAVVALTPLPARNRLRRWVGSRIFHRAIYDKDFFTTYSTRNFFYRRDNLDASLDLMAICAENEAALRAVAPRIRCR